MIAGKKRIPEGIPDNQDEYSIASIILARLKKGSAKRSELAVLTALNDRALREMISFMQSCGALIINLQDGKGYKLASSEAELEKHKMQERSRAFETLLKIKNMKWKEEV